MGPTTVEKGWDVQGCYTHFLRKAASLCKLPSSTTLAVSIQLKSMNQSPYAEYHRARGRTAFSRLAPLCFLLLAGIITAAKDVKLTVPLVVRLEGTNVEKGKALLRESGIKLVTADDLDDAAKKAVAQVVALK